MTMLNRIVSLINIIDLACEWNICEEAQSIKFWSIVCEFINKRIDLLILSAFLLSTNIDSEILFNMLKDLGFENKEIFSIFDFLLEYHKSRFA